MDQKNRRPTKKCFNFKQHICINLHIVFNPRLTIEQNSVPSRSYLRLQWTKRLTSYIALVTPNFWWTRQMVKITFLTWSWGLFWIGIWKRRCFLKRCPLLISTENSTTKQITYQRKHSFWRSVVCLSIRLRTILLQIWYTKTILMN